MKKIMMKLDGFTTIEELKEFCGITDEKHLMTKSRKKKRKHKTNINETDKKLFDKK